MWAYSINAVDLVLSYYTTVSKHFQVDTTSAVALESDYKNTFCYLCRIDFNSSKGLYLHNVKV